MAKLKKLYSPDGWHRVSALDGNGKRGWQISLGGPGMMVGRTLQVEDNDDGTVDVSVSESCMEMMPDYDIHNDRGIVDDDEVIRITVDRDEAQGSIEDCAHAWESCIEI